jgi:hypothetical protein
MAAQWLVDRKTVFVAWEPQRLVISEHTVHRHISNILVKLWPRG